MIARLEGYLLIPHELLHVLGYRLVGKRCTYRWGDRRVTPVGPLTRSEQLVGLLFPFAVCMVVWLLLLPLPVLAFLAGGLTWAIISTTLSGMVLLYASASVGDLRQAYLLLYHQEAHEQTPLDWLFWPVLTERTRGLQTSALIIMVGLILLYVSYLVLR